MKPIASTLEMALLGLIAQKVQAGYDLRKTFSTSAWRHYSDSPGSIYPALGRMKGRGWIEAAGGTRDPLRRQEFRITEAGRTALVSWLERPPTQDEVRFHMPEAMLRFAFMDGNVARTTALEFLDRYIRELEIYVGEMHAQNEQMRSLMRQALGHAPAHTGLLAFESGIAGMEAQLTWARQARIQLAEEASRVR